MSYWKPYMRTEKIKEGRWRVYYPIDKPSSPLPFFLHLFHIFKVKLKLKLKKFKDLCNY
jgi:hypothetical protein